MNPNLESYKTKALGYEADYEEDTVSLDLRFYVTKKKRGAYMSEALTKDDLGNLTLSLRIFCRFQALVYDPLGIIVPTLQSCLRQVFSTLNHHVTQICPDSKSKWDIPILDEEIIAFVKKYMWISLDIAEKLVPIPRARFLTGDTLHSLVLYTDSSVEVAGALLYVVAINIPSGRLHSNLTLSRSKSFPGSVPAGEAFSIRLGLHLLEQFLEEGLGVPFKEDSTFNVVFLSDSQCSLFNLNASKVIEDMSLRNSATSVHAGLHRLCHSHPGLTAFFQWIESETNLSDKLTRVTEENAYFTLNPELRHGNKSLICDPKFPELDKCCIIKTKTSFEFRAHVLLNQIRKPISQDGHLLGPEEVTALMINGLDCLDCQDAPTACGYLKKAPDPRLSSHVKPIKTHPPVDDDPLGENYRMDSILNLFCTTESCEIVDPHSHQGQDFLHRTLELDHYARLVKKSRSLKNACDYLSALLEGIHNWKTKALPMVPPIKKEWFKLEAFNIIVRTSQKHFPIIPKMTSDLVTFCQYGIEMVIQRFHSYLLGPNHCNKRNLPLISSEDPLAEMILKACHLKDSGIGSIISCFHLNGKQTFAASKKSVLGVFILQGHGLSRKVVRSCPRCRKQSTRTHPSPLHSHWWTRLLDTTNGSRFLFNVTAWDIIGPIEVHESTTAARPKKSTHIWFAVGVCVLTRYMTLWPMRDFGAESFLDAVTTLMRKYGFSSLVISDKGTSTFTNRDLVKEYLPNTKVIQAERECLYLNGLCESRIKMLKSLCRSLMNTVRHQRFPSLNVFTLMSVLENAVSLINQAPLPGLTSADYFPVSPSDLALPLRSSTSNDEELDHVEVDSTVPDLRKTHASLQQLKDAVIKVWQESLTSNHVAMSRKTGTPSYMAGDIVFLKYPSRASSGFWKFGIILKQITIDTYLIRYLSRRSQSQVVTHGTIVLDQRMFVLLYRPDPEEDKDFLSSWTTFAQGFQDVPVTKERNRTNDNRKLDQMFRLDHAVPHPPPSDAAGCEAPAPTVDNSSAIEETDPLEELLLAFPAPPLPTENQDPQEVEDALDSFACEVSLYRLQRNCKMPLSRKFFKKLYKKSTSD